MQITNARSAHMVFSIDLQRTQEESSLVTSLVDVLRRHRAPALWSLEFLSPSSVVDRVRGAWPAHEFGLLAGPSWTGLQIPRTFWARELSKRLACAADMGVVPTALALNETDVPEHLDLLVKHRLPLLRTSGGAAGGGVDTMQPRLARYGIWQVHPTLTLPHVSRWSLPWTARRLLQQAVDQGQTVHVAVDAAQLAKNPAAGLGLLDYLLKLAGARRDAGDLQFVPWSDLLANFSPRRATLPSRSVLRAA